MRRTWLVLDVSNLVWRAFLTTGGLSHKVGNKLTGTGMLYGFFQSLQTLCQQHNSRDVVFCFDSGVSLRKKALAGYKAKRHAKQKEWTPEQKEKVGEMKAQVELLRTKLLPRLGYENVFSASGYEGDDVVARVANTLKGRKNTDVVVVSSDKDLYQLLAENVWVWDPVAKKMHSPRTFGNDYGIRPQQWAWVKAASGCLSDEVPGIPGIGEKSAIATFRPDCTDRIVKLVADGQAIIDRNLPLVQLPMKGCPKFKPVRCEVNLGAWRKMCDKYGFRSLRDRPPGGGGGFGLRHNPIRRMEE